MKTLNIKILINEKTFDKMIDFIASGDQADVEQIIANNLIADLEDGDLSILDDRF
jgi:hypothetical protein